jgi:hypothetical protein
MKTSNLIEALTDLQKNLYWRDGPYGPFPSKGAIGGDEGDGGDDCLWLGLLTSVGCAPAATALRQCQAGPNEPKPGMFYRNPIRRSNDNEGHGNFFSRDMGMGVLCALGSRYWDHITAYPIARAWQLWIEKSRICLVKKPKWLGGGCAVRGPYQLAPDDRSIVTPAFWALIGRVWRENGWPTSSEMERNDGMDGDWSIIEAENCDLGYQLHLHAIESWLKLIMDQSREYQEKMARICYQRMPENRFYKLLMDKRPSDDDITWLIDLISSRPPILSDHWIWESSNISQALADHEYCGWDLLFLGYAYLKLSN